MKIGDLVLFKNMATKKGQSKKLMHVWNGPHKIVEVYLPNVELQDQRKPEKKSFKAHVSNLKRFSTEKLSTDENFSDE